MVPRRAVALPLMLALALASARSESQSVADEVVCDVTRDYGIKFGLTDQTTTIRAAIADCRRRALALSPGARAVVLFPNHNLCATRPAPNASCDEQEDIVGDPDGTVLPFLTGAINMTSNMTLRIERGAMLQGVPAATLFHYPLVVQYAAYGDGTTPGWMPNEGGDNATYPNGERHCTLTTAMSASPGSLLLPRQVPTAMARASRRSSGRRSAPRTSCWRGVGSSTATDPSGGARRGWAMPAATTRALRLGCRRRAAARHGTSSRSSARTSASRA